MKTCRGRGRVSRSRGATAVLFALAIPAALAAEPAPLPSPLTLEQALAAADVDHPDLLVARSRLERARAGQLDADARDDLRAQVDITPERVEPTTGGGNINDSRARLLLSKSLYDFGRTRALESAAAAEVAGRELQLLDARAARRLDVMSRFFDVLLADMRYAADNEHMASLYVQFDRLRERHQLGQVSEVDLAEAENRYREALVRRTDAEKRKVATRLALAVTLDRPDELPRELIVPKLPGLDQPAPDYQQTASDVLARSPLLLALRKEVEAARDTVEAERARRRPVLTGELEAAEWERALASRSDRRAMLNLRIPLYQGAEVEAALAQAAAEVATREARLKRAEHDVRRAVLDAVQEIEAARVRRETARQRVSFRDLYLDRARAIYEMEVQTSLGDAMARLTEAQWLAAKADFELALGWARLDALTGRLVQSSEPPKERP